MIYKQYKPTKMQLRNGKNLDIEHKVFNKIREFISKINESKMKQSQIQTIDHIRKLFDFVNESLSAMKTNQRLIVTMYTKGIELTKNIIEKTYETREWSEQDKAIVIRALNSIYITNVIREI